MARKSDQTTLIYLGLGGAALLAMLSARRQIVSLFGRAVEAGKELQFKLSLPTRAQKYADVILSVARSEGVDPWLIFALGDRESNWGETLTPRGPTGTGDWTPRTWGPYPLPPDGLGWGRGLMQLDYANALKVNWKDPAENIRAGVRHLKAKLDYFARAPSTPTVTLSTKEAERRGVAPGVYKDVRPLTGTALWQAGIAAYNTGEINVLRNLAAGKPAEFTTTGGDYVADVSTRAANAASKMPA